MRGSGECHKTIYISELEKAKITKPENRFQIAEVYHKQLEVF